MKEIICWIFGHLPVSVNVGSYESPEQGYVCEYCYKDLSEITDWKEYGLSLNTRVTRFLKQIKNNRIKNLDDDEIPF